MVDSIHGGRISARTETIGEVSAEDSLVLEKPDGEVKGRQHDKEYRTDDELVLQSVLAALASWQSSVQRTSQQLDGLVSTMPAAAPAVMSGERLRRAQQTFDDVTARRPGEALAQQRIAANGELLKQVVGAYPSVLAAVRTELQQQRFEGSEFDETSLLKYSLISDQELFGKLIDLIGGIDKHYRSPQADAAKRYMTLMQAVSEEITSKLSGWISMPDKDKNKKEDKDDIELNVGELKQNINELITRFEGKDGEILECDTDDSADKWAQKLGLPKSSVVEVKEGNGKYSLRVDITPLRSMITSLDGYKDKQTMNLARYQAWRASYDTNTGVISTKVQQLVEQFSRVNSTVDNIIKVLSSTISACTDIAKTFLQFS